MRLYERCSEKYERTERRKRNEDLESEEAK
jgi:hypothetical protein